MNARRPQNDTPETDTTFLEGRACTEQQRHMEKLLCSHSSSRSQSLAKELQKQTPTRQCNNANKAFITPGMPRVCIERGFLLSECYQRRASSIFAKLDSIDSFKIRSSAFTNTIPSMSFAVGCSAILSLGVSLGGVRLHSRGIRTICHLPAPIPARQRRLVLELHALQAHLVAGVGPEFDKLLVDPAPAVMPSPDLSMNQPARNRAFRQDDRPEMPNPHPCRRF